MGRKKAHMQMTLQAKVFKATGLSFFSICENELQTALADVAAGYICSGDMIPRMYMHKEWTAHVGEIPKLLGALGEFLPITRYIYRRILIYYTYYTTVPDG